MIAVDKEEFRIKLEQINYLVEKKDYKGAMDVVDSIDWRRVKNVRTLCVVGEIYAANKRYSDSREIFLLAYHRASIGKNILYRLIEISLKMGELDEAEEFYEEYEEIAPNDNTKYVLRYKIDRDKNAPLDKQISSLETYKEKEFTEKWAYELAKLYSEAGEEEKCVSLCNEMVLWFSDGSYVEKALDLKKQFGQLTDKEKEIISAVKKEEISTESGNSAEEGVYPEGEPGNDDENHILSKEEGEDLTEDLNDADDRSEPNIGSIYIRSDRDLRGTETLPEKITKGIRDIFGNKQKSADDEVSDELPEALLGKTEFTEEEINSIPNLEKEGQPKISVEKKAFTESMKLPELNIPDVLKKGPEELDLVAPDIKNPNNILGNAEDVSGASSEKKYPEEREFNLEESILAAATELGIEIPAKNKKSSENKEESLPHDEMEEISEEDLKLAEEEFLNGPAASKGEKSQEEQEKVILSGEEKEDADHQISDRTKIILRGNDFTEDEKKIFSYFTKIPGMKEQIVECLKNVQTGATDITSNQGNIVVMGGKQSGKTRLISALIPAICNDLNLEAVKVAYVFADQINGKYIHAIAKKLSGGFLVIEEANQLDQETANKLDKVMGRNTDGMIVILEDDKIGMRKFLARNPKLAKKFDSIINIPVFMNDELVSFANVYAKENGCKIDQMGMLALYNLIGENQKADEPMSIGDVKGYIDKAIAKANSGLFNKRSKKRKGQDGCIILHERDFV